MFHVCGRLCEICDRLRRQARLIVWTGRVWFVFHPLLLFLLFSCSTLFHVCGRLCEICERLRRTSHDTAQARLIVWTGRVWFVFYPLLLFLLFSCNTLFHVCGRSQWSFHQTVHGLCSLFEVCYLTQLHHHNRYRCGIDVSILLCCTVDKCMDFFFGKACRNSSIEKLREGIVLIIIVLQLRFNLGREHHVRHHDRYVLAFGFIDSSLRSTIDVLEVNFFVIFIVLIFTLSVA